MRNAIRNYLSGNVEATAKQIADATGFELIDITKELNAMLKDAEVERHKHAGEGPAYFYWLSKPQTHTAIAEVPTFTAASHQETQSAQPEVAPSNAGSSGPESPPATTYLAGAAAIPYTAENAANVQELANALDKITEQRQEIERLANLVTNLRIECDNLESRQRTIGDFPLGEIVTHLQKLLPEEVHIDIENDSVTVYDDNHDEEYTADPAGVLPLIDAINLIRRRKVA